MIARFGLSIIVSYEKINKNRELVIGIVSNDIDNRLNDLRFLWKFRVDCILGNCTGMA